LSILKLKLQNDSIFRNKFEFQVIHTYKNNAVSDNI